MAIFKAALSLFRLNCRLILIAMSIKNDISPVNMNAQDSSVRRWNQRPEVWGAAFVYIAKMAKIVYMLQVSVSCSFGQLEKAAGHTDSQQFLCWLLVFMANILVYEECNGLSVGCVELCCICVSFLAFSLPGWPHTKGKSIVRHFWRLLCLGRHPLDGKTLHSQRWW